MDDGFNPSLLQGWKTPIRKFYRVRNFIQIIREQFMAKVPRGTLNSPRATGLLIKTDTQTTPFLTQITFATGVHHVGMLGIAFGDHRNIVRDNILMLHGMQRQIDSGHSSYFTCPQACRIHHVLGDHGTLVSDNFPATIRAWNGFGHLGMQLNLGAVKACCLCIGMGCARRVKMAIQRIVKPTKHTMGVGRWRDFFDLCRGQYLGIQSHVAMLGALSF